MRLYQSNPAIYYKNCFKEVTVVARIQSTAPLGITYGTAVGILPAGYRPIVSIVFPATVLVNSGLTISSADIVISTNGGIYIYPAGIGGAYTTWDQVIFQAHFLAS